MFAGGAARTIGDGKNSGLKQKFLLYLNQFIPALIGFGGEKFKAESNVIVHGISRVEFRPLMQGGQLVAFTMCGISVKRFCSHIEFGGQARFAHPTKRSFLSFPRSAWEMHNLELPYIQFQAVN